VIEGKQSKLSEGAVEEACIDGGDAEERRVLEVKVEEEAVEAAEALELEESWTLAEARGTPGLWIMLVHSFVDGTLNGGNTFHRMSIVNENVAEFHNAAFDVASSIYIPQSIVMGCTVLLCGTLLDRGMNPRIPLLLNLVANSACFFALTLPLTSWTGALHGSLQGVVFACSFGTKSVLLAHFFGRQHIGSILGLEKCVVILGTAAGPLLFGVVHDMLGSYHAVLWFGVALPLLIIPLVALLKKTEKLEPVPVSSLQLKEYTELKQVGLQREEDVEMPRVGDAVVLGLVPASDHICKEGS